MGIIAIGCGGAPTDSVESSVQSTRTSLKDLELLEKGLTPATGGEAGNGLDLSTGIQSRTDLPSLPARPSSRSEDIQIKRKQEWAAQNWLLAGMQSNAITANREGKSDSNPGARTSAAADLANSAEGNGDYWLAMALSEQERLDAQEQPDESRDDLRAIESMNANPLAEFMQDWVQPEDLELINELSNLSADGQRGEFEIGTLPSSVGRGREEVSNSRFREFENGIKTTNPFLEGWGDGSAVSNPVSAASRGELGQKIELRTTNSTVTTRPVPPTSVHSERETPKPVKEAWRPPPRTDEKYFPRLKRF